MRKSFKYLELLVVVFAAALLISNISATKLVQIGPILTDGGAVLFPLVYILGDIITEVYGYKRMRRAIWLAFVVMVVAVGAFTAVRYLPAAPEYTNQAAFEAILGFFPRIVVASLAAFLVGSFVNSYILAKMKVASKGKRLWARLMGSTVVGELLDTIVFAVIAFGGVLGGMDMLNYVLAGWIFKTAVEALLLPLTYKIVASIKRRERLDVYDKKTDFSPFSFVD